MKKKIIKTHCYIEFGSSKRVRGKHLCTVKYSGGIDGFASPHRAIVGGISIPVKRLYEATLSYSVSNYHRKKYVDELMKCQTKTEMNQGMDTLYGAMMLTAENAGMKVISDDWCCKLLAWLSVYGGATEAVVSNNMLYVDLMVSKQRLNIEGGEIPKAELVATMQGYVKEIREKKADWIEEIEKKYKVVSRL